MFAKLKQPVNLIPLIITAGLALLLFLTARPEAGLPAGSWLYELRQGRFLPVIRTTAATRASLRGSRNGFTRLSLQRPEATLWAPTGRVMIKDRFPASLLRGFRGHRAQKNAFPFLTRKKDGSITIKAWLYPVFLLFALLFLIQKPIIKTTAAVLLGAFLFIYSLQITGMQTGRKPPISRIR